MSYRAYRPLARAYRAAKLAADRAHPGDWLDPEVGGPLARARLEAYRAFQAGELALRRTALFGPDRLRAGEVGAWSYASEFPVMARQWWLWRLVTPTRKAEIGRSTRVEFRAAPPVRGDYEVWLELTHADGYFTRTVLKVPAT